MPILPRRRWLQFSLRTMLVAVTVVAILLGWQLSHIRDRRAFVVSMEALVAQENEQAGRALVSPHPGTLTGTPVNIVVPNGSIPIWRRLLGDEAMLLMWLPRTSTPEDLHSAHRLFPEAKVYQAK